MNKAKFGITPCASPIEYNLMFQCFELYSGYNLNNLYHITRSLPMEFGKYLWITPFLYCTTPVQ